VASGAGLNRWGNNGGVTLLAGLSSTTTAVATPLTGYGTVSNQNGVALAGGNDSGVWGCAAMGFTKWVFQLLGNLTGISVTLYGTIDPNAYLVYTANSGVDGFTTGSLYLGGAPQRSAVAVPASSWFVLPGPSEQTGTGSIANPLTSTTPLFVASMPLVAVRAVVTTSTAAAGNGSVIGFAVP
jgi:hypothetical protein